MTATLSDPFGRRIEYLRLSVSDRCDLRCFYCMPKGFGDYEAPEHWLGFSEIERLVAAFTALGVRRVRLTGGEPLLRRDLPELAARLARLPGIEDLSLSTNATHLARHAQALHTAGVRRINVSLDTLRPARFREICGGNLDKVLAGLMAAKAAGFQPIKLNMVVMRGVNDDEVEAMVEFCIAHDFTLRFIETMPMGSTGHAATERYLDLAQVRERLAQRYELIPAVMAGGGPAQYFQVAGTALKLGFITPISQHFCATCNRVRVSVDGVLYPCLGEEQSIALRPLLRAGVDDQELHSALRAAVALKPERHRFRERATPVVRFMSQTGG